jgi:hypothetical protein
VAWWIGVVGVVVVPSGCTGGSAAGPGLGTASIHRPRAAHGPCRCRRRRIWSAADPVLTVEALPFAEASDAALPAPRPQALQQALEETVRDSTRMPGVTPQ